MTTQGLRDGDSAILRKARGAFFTPDALTDYVAAWALRTPVDSVFEPSCGEAAFLLSAGRHLAELAPTSEPEQAPKLEGVELHGVSADHAERLLAEQGLSATIRVADFFSVQPEARFDAVIGNPPYVRYQDFGGESRARSREAAMRAGVRLTGLASSWAAFTVHSALFLKDGGRLGLVLPAELLTVNYAAQVRQFLMQRFRSVRLVLFTERVFPGVLEEVVLLLADGFNEGPTDHCELYQTQNADTLATAVGRSWRPSSPAGKWSPSLLSEAGVAAIQGVDAGGQFTTLDTWGRTTLGMVTGNNRYFTLSPQEVKKHGLTLFDVVRLSPPGSRHLRGLSLGESAWKQLGADGKATYLFRPGDEPSAAARKYIDAGEAIGVDEAYKCQVRKPWWRVPLVKPAHLFLTYMNADTPRLTTNRAKVRHLNSVHGVYLKPGFIRTGSDLLPLAALNSMTLLGAETVGRAYGGGMLKIEPREADGLPVPSKAALEAARENLMAIRPQVGQALRSGKITDAAKLIDDVLLVRHMGMNRGDVSALREAHALLHGRRVARNAAPR